MSGVQFSHGQVGTAESDWSSWLRQLPCVDASAVQGPVVVVSPHPDDEVLAVGGMLQGLARLGTEVTVVSLTDGEGADTSDPNLGEVRHGELRSALDRLGSPPIPFVRVGLPDGGLATMRSEHLADVIGDAGGSARTWIAPLPGDGHPDHDAAGRAAALHAQRTAGRLWQYAVWAWHWGGRTDVPLERAVRVELDARTMARKRQAIDEFRSQVSGPDPIVNARVRAHFERPFEVFFT